MENKLEKRPCSTQTSCFHVKGHRKHTCLSPPPPETYLAHQEVGFVLHIPIKIWAITASSSCDNLFQLILLLCACQPLNNNNNNMN